MAILLKANSSLRKKIIQCQLKRVCKKFVQKNCAKFFWKTVLLLQEGIFQINNEQIHIHPQSFQIGNKDKGEFSDRETDKGELSDREYR